MAKRLNPNKPSNKSDLAFIHYYNAIGKYFHTGRIAPPALEHPKEFVDVMMKRTNMKLETFDEKNMIGVFSFGPLPGLMVISKSSIPKKISESLAAEIITHLQKLESA